MEGGWQSNRSAFLGGAEFFALTHAAFQQVADAKLTRGYSREVEKKLLNLFAP